MRLEGLGKLKKSPRRIFRPKRVEVIESWRTFHNEKLHNIIVKIIK
jgi:hypothetical protein